MKVTELRIGNWIQDREGRECRVTELHEDDDEITALVKGGFTVLPHKPIPITAEWLERFGLRPTNERPYSWKDGVYEYFVNIGQERLVVWDNNVPMNGYPCKYVHQLQNLYHALTGEEL